jgi:hypothetical protein
MSAALVYVSQNTPARLAENKVRAWSTRSDAAHVCPCGLQLAEGFDSDQRTILEHAAYTEIARWRIAARENQDRRIATKVFHGYGPENRRP